MTGKGLCGHMNYVFNHNMQMAGCKCGENSTKVLTPLAFPQHFYLVEIILEFEIVSFALCGSFGLSGITSEWPKHLSIIADKIHRVMLVVHLTSLPGMDTFNRTVLHVIKLELHADGSKSMIETLPCLFNLISPQILIQLKIWGLWSKGAPSNWIQYYQILRN